MVYILIPFFFFLFYIFLFHSELPKRVLIYIMHAVIALNPSIKSFWFMGKLLEGFKKQLLINKENYTSQVVLLFLIGRLAVFSLVVLRCDFYYIILFVTFLYEIDDGNW